MPVLDATALRPQLLARLAEWRGLLGREVAWSRQLLTKLLDGRVTFTPTTDTDGAPAYEVSATLTLGRFFSGILLPNGMASPAGSVRRGNAAVQRVLRSHGCLTVSKCPPAIRCEFDTDWIDGASDYLRAA